MKMKQGSGKPQIGGQTLNHEQEKIKDWIEQVRFRHKLFGGVDEADLWKKIAELNEMYQKALSAERARYDALLENGWTEALGKAGDESVG